VTRPIPARAQIVFIRRRFGDAITSGDSDTAPRLRGSARAAAQGGSGRVSAVKVLEVRRVGGSGSLKAIAKVRLGSITIHSCRIIQVPWSTDATGTTMEFPHPWVSLSVTEQRRRLRCE
jgi:hypothetical protein